MITHECPICGYGCACIPGEQDLNRCQCCEGDENPDMIIPVNEPDAEQDSRLIDRANARSINRRIS